MPLIHHELCFGCGRTNLFGLLLEVEQTAPGEVSGRCFIKQDHQGADRGSAHDGVLAAALCEAMALAGGADARLRTVDVSFEERVAVGTFLEVSARVEGDAATATASASAGGRPVASARGVIAKG